MANQSHGFDVTVVLGKETTFGTKASAFKWPGIVESFEPSESNNVDTRRSIGVRGPYMLRRGAKGIEGSMSVALQNGRLLLAALGNVSTTGAGPYVHAITPAAAGDVLPSFTIQENDANLNKKTNYVGAKVNSMTLTAAVEEAVMVEIDWLIKDALPEAGAAAAVVGELDNYFMFYEGTVEINGVAVTNVTQFEVEVANGLEARRGIAGSRAAQRIEEGALEITGSLTMDMTDLVQHQAFVDGDEISVTLTLIDEADADHQVVVSLTGGLYDTSDAGIAAEDLREHELEVIFKDIAIEVTDANANLF
ncbi:hypothetical protein EG878_14550 [Enterococcus faecalis]|nr:hypothetical protein EG878_14550 [Enterococcus faecalis]